MKEYQKKEIAFERVLFFSDAIVAIAITLLALDLKVNVPEERHIVFKDLLLPWHKYLAFILSFFSIAGFWRKHHDFFIYIRKMDDKLMALNTGWLFFIVTLPFATALLSTHFGDTPSVFLYSLNILMISIFQNCIWDYADLKNHFDKDGMPGIKQKDFRIMLNLDMINGLIAVVVSFWMPKLAFFLLFFKIPLVIITAFFVAGRRRKTIQEERDKL